MYCTLCLQPCEVATFSVPEFYIDGELKTRDVTYEASACCEGELSPNYPGPICIACDDLAVLRCTECGEWHCASCFGPNRVDGGGPCPECAVSLAREGVY